MSDLEALKVAKKRLVGVKQTVKALEKGGLRVVFVARDADERIIQPLVRLCGERDVAVVYVESMGLLGKACGIEVGAAAAALPS